MVSFSLRQRILFPPPAFQSPVSFHLSQFVESFSFQESPAFTTVTAKNQTP